MYTHGEFNSMSSSSIKIVYNKLMSESVKVTWDTTFWNRLNVAKYRFILWLAMQVMLQTTTRLAQYGIS